MAIEAALAMLQLDGRWLMQLRAGDLPGPWFAQLRRSLQLRN